MPTARRRRTFDATPERAARVILDPNQLPRWWPKVTRVEGLDPSSFTKVFVTSKGRPVRADFRIVEMDDTSRRWVQVVEDTPFARILLTSEEFAAVEDDGGRARVTIEVRQKLRGLSKFGGFLVKRATRKQLDEALDALDALL